ncbi:hypothetical protein [Leptospira santarosai]|uniref:hypothetical protein n=1 Tax=Leptospira santarosai TaxID=28183 RepID=UPI00063B5A05|nr:hypothetical protein [Leptospira santarosai]AVV52089.1 Uncharacterized protein XB17_03528 [Leptospira santarosai]AVV81078.1 Uncharacterized protein XB15_03341 [Leptospira santarosai]MDI7165983.1 hypothetical protein [Leptospira santarosai]MDI7203506.1 hypothetical protein [Leptospira santarosai]MDO6393799.1 hypothetical protein [Leptospira santarosai]
MTLIALDLVLNLLKKERDERIARLRQNVQTEENLNFKLQMDRAILCLEYCEKYKINPPTIKNTIELPILDTGWSDWRILNDCETDDRSYWIELTKEGRPVYLSSGDLLIER